MEEIRKLVQQKLKDRHQEIILSIYSRAIQGHEGYDRNYPDNENCKCEYCIACSKYVEQKILWKKWLRCQDDMFPVHHMWTGSTEQYVRVKRELKESKDKFKKICN